MQRHARSVFAFALLAGLASPAWASLDSGVRVIPTYITSEFDSGLKVDLRTLPVTMFVRSERLSLRATFPFMQMKADVPAFVVGGPIFQFTVPGQTLSEEGPGDVLLNPAVLIVKGDLDSPSVWGGVRLKVPTANEDDFLGTGEFDYGPAIGILQPVGDRLLLSGTATYIVRGDPPDRDLANTLGATVAGRVRLFDFSGVTLSVLRGDSAVPDGAPVMGASLAYDHLFEKNGTSIYGGVYRGQSAEGEGYGLSIGFTWRDEPLPWGS